MLDTNYWKALIGTVFLFLLIELAVLLMASGVISLYLIGVFDLSICFLISLYINYKFIRYENKGVKCQT